jgi:hypothetical protein
VRIVDALVDVVVGLYAPLPRASLSNVVARLRYAVPQWQSELKSALLRARERLSHATSTAWTGTGQPRSGFPRMRRRTPCACWRRSTRCLGPPPLRDALGLGLPVRGLHAGGQNATRGYYALPMLWRDRVIGWANSP